MNNQTFWLVALIILALAQALVLVLRLSVNKKNNPSKYGERIATLEEAVENIKEDIMEIKDKLNRK